MKVVALPIEVVAWFDKAGIPRLVRFRIIENDQERVIKLSKNMLGEKEKQAGKVMYKFNCTSVINGVQRGIELRYYLESTKWILFKILKEYDSIVQ